MKKNVKRSKFIKWGIITTIVIALIAWDMAFTSIQTVIEGSYVEDSYFSQFTPAPATTVAVVASDNVNLDNPIAVTSSSISFAQVENMVESAINLVGGITNYVQNGDTVIIKPNIVDADNTGNGENTDVRVVKAIIRLIYKSYGNNCKIYIGEGSARSISTFGGTLFGNTQFAYSLLSVDSDLSGINFELLDLNDGTSGANCVYQQSKASLAYPQGGKYWIHKYLRSPNIKFINVPVLKMHEPGITNALKNQIGVAAGAVYGYNKISGTTFNGTFYELIHHDRYNANNNYKTWQDEEIVDLVSCIDKIDLNVVDAILCLETQKTCTSGCGNQKRLNTVIAGADPVAVDHVCARIIGTNPDDIAHITMADKIGLGTNNSDSITILGENIATKYTYQFNRGVFHNQFGQGNRVWLISDAFSGSNMSTQYIANEGSLAPSNGSADWSVPIYFFDDRIDLASYFNPSGSVVAYCYTNVYSPTAKSNVELWINSEEDIIVYLNGTNIYSYSGSRANANLVTDKPTINLLEGENTLLVKVLQTTGCYDFALNICEPNTNGNRVDGLKFYIKNYNEPAALDPTPTLTAPSNKSQTVELGSPISTITFTWGGGATDVSVTGLPSGLTAIKNSGNKTLTITGTPLAEAVSTYTVTTIGGVGTAASASGTINAISCAGLPKAVISNLASTGTYKLILYDASGTTPIRTLANGTFVAGNTKFYFSKGSLADGTYMYKLFSGQTVVKTGTVTVP